MVSISPWDAEVADGWMYGRGAGDMKAGLVANLFAFDAIREAGFNLTGRIHLQSVVEEGMHRKRIPGRFLLRGYTADAVIISEPEEDALVRANVGVLWFTVRVTGNPTHPREMANGFNAIDAAFDVMQALRVLEQTWNDCKADHPFSRTSTTPSTSTSGRSAAATGPRACLPGANSRSAWPPTPERTPMMPGPRSKSACPMPERVHARPLKLF